MLGYASRRKVPALPRLPLKGTLDLTYRCNNDCVHCWLRLPPGAPEKADELTLDEIRGLAGEARALGCRQWNLFGGEPMLRPDFPEIFEILTGRSSGYTLNTNGTLFTPEIARLLRRPGAKLVSLYGATADVHDAVTRRPGSFDALMRGFALLKEAGAAFTVQIVPMRANFRQLEAMIALAERLSPLWRYGATWLYLSASGDPERNREILAQRLTPAETVRLDGPIGAFREDGDPEDGACAFSPAGGLYAGCLSERRDFHVDAYGRLSFCAYVKDPALRYDLRRGSLEEGWGTFIPSLAGAAGPRSEARECGDCGLKADCKWCPALAWLERRDHGAKVDLFCGIARETRAAARDWEARHRRYYRMAGVTIRVDSDLELAPDTFEPKFEPFRVDGPGDDTIAIHHHFGLPDLAGRDLGPEIYRKPPYVIHRLGDAWVYVGLYPGPGDRVDRVCVFSADHARGRIYHGTETQFRTGQSAALTLFSSDQILLGRILADRAGFYLHAAGFVMNGKGLLFSGPSEAGKSTTMKLLRGRGEILCDDRIVVRRHDDGWRIHGTWSHGELPDVSPANAPLAGLFFLRQATENRIVPIADPGLRFRWLIERVIRPLATGDWWAKTLEIAAAVAREVPAFELHFDKSGRIAGLLEEFVR